MSGGVLSVPCNLCRRAFENGSVLKNHIKRDHQQSVKVTFGNSDIIDVKRESDGSFRCFCNRRFDLPGSLQRHAKSCQGFENEAKDDEEEEEKGEEEDLESDSLEENLLCDCMGKFQFIYTRLTLFSTQKMKD